MQGFVPEYIALIDDVATTGATLREAKACLIAAGAKEVVCWVVAQTEDRDFARTMREKSSNHHTKLHDLPLGYDAGYGL